MFCARCLYRLPNISPSQCLRFLSTTPSTHLPSNPPAATSTSAAQPFSTPFTPSPSSLGITPKKSPAEPESEPRVISSVKAGTPLKGLAFIKERDAPVAKEDSEYPDWLWGLLDGKKGKDKDGDGKGEGDLFSKSKKQRRIAARKARKVDPSSLVPKVPLQAQTIDLPYGNASGGDEDLGAQRTREKLKVAMRADRRKGIKERNFLITMK